MGISVKKYFCLCVIGVGGNDSRLREILGNRSKMVG